MTERISEADIVYISDFRAAKRAPLPQRIPSPPSIEFTLPEPRPRFKLFRGIDVLNGSVVITIDEVNPLFDDLRIEMTVDDFNELDY